MYFFCEAAASARPYKHWHIRKHGEKGRCPGGGADTDALCGTEVDWDLGPTVDVETVEEDGVCTGCAERWAENINSDEILRLLDSDVRDVEDLLLNRPLPFSVEVPGCVIDIETDRERRLFLDGYGSATYKSRAD